MSMSSLEIGRKALQAQRYGLDVTSNNIANANTVGYSRRDAQFSQTSPLYQYGNFVGTGAVVKKMRSFREDFFDREIRNTINREAGLEADEKVLDRVETLLAEPTEENLNESVTKFFRAFDELALKPESIGLRENVIQVGKTVADKFNFISNEMLEARKEIQIDANSLINEANRLIKEVAQMNAAFSSNRNLTGDEQQTLIDEREVRLEELSKLFNIGVTTEDDNSVNVFINGANVITRTTPSELKLEQTIDENTGELAIKMTRFDHRGKELGVVNAGTGELGSLIYHYNVTLDDKDSTGEFSAAKRLNDFAVAIVKNVNEVSNQGYGLDDPDGAAPGRNFFELSHVGPAMKMSVSDDIWLKPRDLPLAGASREPGNSEIARAIARLADKEDFIDNDDYTEFYAGYIGKVGSQAREIKDTLANIMRVSEQLQSQREAMIGVNLNEEAVNLIKFQKAFEAASRIVNTTNEILQTVISLGT